MSAEMLLGLIGVGFIMGISAVGSGIGIGIAGSAAIGAWKRCFKANKPAPMTLLVFAGAPLTQVFYGFILMQSLRDAVTASNGGVVFGMAIGSGLAQTFSAIAQGQACAAAADAFSETGKGFANYIGVIGICETVALFAMVLTMTSLG